MIHIPHPVTQSSRYIKLLAPSKSQPLQPRQVHLYASGKHHCGCPGHLWFVRLRQYFKQCRHHKMSTIQTARRPAHNLNYAYKLMKDSSKKLYITWAFINCQHPEHRPVAAIRCFKCSLYPAICNIHPIYYGSRHRNKPLVWKLQTAIYHGRRSESLRLLRKLIKEVNNNEPR